MKLNEKIKAIRLLYNGTCAIRTSNKDLFRKIKGWRLGIVDYFEI